MNWLDIVIAVALVAAAFGGLTQGLIKAAVSLAGIAVGVVLAGRFQEQVGSLLTFISNPDIASIVAYVLIIVVVLVIAALLANLLRSTARAIMLGWVDRLGGAAFGLLIGGFFVGAILATIVKFFGQGLITDSLLAAFLLDKFPLVLALLPADFDVVRDFFQ